MKKSGEINTLVLHAYDAPSIKRIIAVSALTGVFGLTHESKLVSSFKNFPFLRKLRVALSEGYRVLGYTTDWLDAILSCPRLNVTLCNVSNLFEFYRYCHRDIAQFDLIIIMHSAAGDNMVLLNSTAHLFLKRTGKLVVFIGNEYDILHEKKKFLTESGADFVLTQLPKQAAEFLYGNIPHTKIIEMPHALNPSRYFCDDSAPRTWDFGFIGARYPMWIGDETRNSLLSAIAEKSRLMNLNSQMVVGRQNIVSDQWSSFLQSCKLTCGAEAGTDYLDENGALIARAKSFLTAKPEATFGEMMDACFSEINIEYRSGKAISSRHFEPIGTKTCQVLLEGSYNGILLPDVHYLSVKKDQSNLDEKIREGLDPERRKEIVENAYRLVLQHHTYKHRIETLINSIYGLGCTKSDESSVTLSAIPLARRTN
jgi:Glycosyl transferases group 1